MSCPPILYGPSENEAQGYKLFPKDAEIYTQLPKTAALCRIVTILALTILLAANFTVACCPILVSGIVLAGWTTYSQILTEDHMVKLFKQALGGTMDPSFPLLPEIKLEQTPEEPLGNALIKLDWKAI